VFSAKLERHREFDRLAVLVAATLLAVGIALIAVWALRALKMLGAAEVDRAPIIIGVLIALAVLVVLCLIVYAAVRAVCRFTSR
jgi:amino acid transporter